MKNDNGKTLKSMTFDELTVHIQGLFNEAHSLKRQAALVVVRAGEALALAQKTLPKEKTWIKFQEELGLPRSTVNEAIRLHLAAKSAGLSEKDLVNLGVMDAKYRLGIRLRGGKTGSKNGRRAIVIPRPSKKNVMKVVDRSMRLLQESLEVVEREGVAFDVRSLPDFSRLVERWNQLDTLHNHQPVAAKG